MEIYNVEYFKDYLEKLFKMLGIKITMQLVDRGEDNTDILLTYNNKIYRLNDYNDIQEENKIDKMEKELNLTIYEPNENDDNLIYIMYNSLLTKEGKGWNKEYLQELCDYISDLKKQKEELIACLRKNQESIENLLNNLY